MIQTEQLILYMTFVLDIPPWHGPILAGEERLNYDIYARFKTQSKGYCIKCTCYAQFRALHSPIKTWK